MEQKRERIWELDALRGFCIVCVIFVHFMFDLVYFLGKQVDFPPLYTFIQQYGGAIFVVLSGCCATLGSRSFRRGVLVFGCGMLITLVTFGMYRMGMAASDVVVKFGVLHLLGVCMMFYPLLKKLPTTALSVLAAAIVAIGYAIQGMRFSVRWLFPLGFVYPGFTSSDFFREVNSHRAVRYCGDHLPQHLGAHITRGEHAGEIRAGGFVCHDIAGLVQRQLASEQLRRRGASHADEQPVAGKLPLRAGVDVF